MADQIFVKHFGNVFCIPICSKTCASDVLQYLCENEGLDYLADSDAKLFSCVGVVENDTNIASINSTYYELIHGLDGGAKKRKKKQHTTPKKNKHKKKKVKLAPLKYYKIEKDDKVVRLLKECPSSTCGRGVFMASHHNRTYCGRCGLTYISKTAEITA
ncbi:small subunit ribosomal protein S27Ae [Babesia microti strain RI]|uniref:Small subunit ribosomal protein S27Ae n=1 Tax=Babesia microti (strain RI) TaxID=1133968 RepID=I7JD28_BABMR|nr:small subunit ribosomal protein S27Ae [Babesia microti strain RI]CCF75580.1 small subunit ribosomal protein S27Ae [Babesia microti strain RI]|eukprot:XP_012649988.1 small subunit ribosomal protein S27Ae [Babesia microti strain RI]